MPGTKKTLSKADTAPINSPRHPQSVSTLIHEISLMVARIFNRQVKDMGITHSQWQVLYLLYSHGAQTQTSIANALLMAKPPLGKVLERLEQGGWIERKSDARDRRAKLVHLTSKIKPRLQSLEQLVEDIGDTAMQGMSKKSASQFYDSLKLAHLNLRAEDQKI